MLWFIAGVFVGMIPLLLMIAFCLYCGDHKAGEYIETTYKVEYNVDGCQGDDWHTALDKGGKQIVNVSYDEAKHLAFECKSRDKRNEYRVIRVTEQVME